jgi:hypothetical protein
MSLDLAFATWAPNCPEYDMPLGDRHFFFSIFFHTGYWYSIRSKLSLRLALHSAKTAFFTLDASSVSINLIGKCFSKLLIFFRMRF